jgi:hypothetical protein
MRKLLLIITTLLPCIAINESHAQTPAPTANNPLSQPRRTAHRIEIHLTRTVTDEWSAKAWEYQGGPIGGDDPRTEVPVSVHYKDGVFIVDTKGVSLTVTYHGSGWEVKNDNAKLEAQLQVGGTLLFNPDGSYWGAIETDLALNFVYIIHLLGQ